jgi:hypothetical protein
LLDTGEIDALADEIAAKERRSQIPWADLYALLCNLLAHGKRTWKREDFLPAEGKAEAPPAEVQAALLKYEADVARRREDYRKRKEIAQG